MFIVFDNSEKHKKAERIEENDRTITHELISTKTDYSNTQNQWFMYTRSILLRHLANTKYPNPILARQPCLQQRGFLGIDHWRNSYMYVNHQTDEGEKYEKTVKILR